MGRTARHRTPENPVRHDTTPTRAEATGRDRRWRRSAALGLGRSLLAVSVRAAVSISLALPVAGGAGASTIRGSDPASQCDTAAAGASAATGVPEAVLRALSRTETGRQRNGELAPWPWTVNLEGKGIWFDDAASALGFAEAARARGSRSFDVGCFQINYRWHGHAFGSVAEMFDPKANALYAAKFLLDLFGETGDWASAAAAYHSRTPKFANRYRARYERILAGIAGAPGVAEVPAPALAPVSPRQQIVQRENSFPLFLGGGPLAPGSLFPASAGAGGQRLIGGG